MSVVIAHAAYLPSAQCFALLPIASTLARTGADTACALDYDVEQGCVTLTAQKTVRFAGTQQIKADPQQKRIALSM